jgi:hypothetical protein
VVVRAEGVVRVVLEGVVLLLFAENAAAAAAAVVGPGRPDRGLLQADDGVHGLVE